MLVQVKTYFLLFKGKLKMENCHKMLLKGCWNYIKIIEMQSYKLKIIKQMRLSCPTWLLHLIVFSLM
nr:hypothetical protein Iba_chr15dCG1800 [Ipomoea batatas]